MKKLIIYKMGACDECYKTNSLVAVYGLLPGSFSYICQGCLNLFTRIAPFQACASCECLLNEIKKYPNDCAVSDQKTYCGLCYDLIKAEDFVLDNTPKSQRKLTEKAIKEMEEKEK